ncbi:MAG: acyltransferase [Bacteroidetes bacterium]|nr:acyltransferase [Bacteroidota bacterium]
MTAERKSSYMPQLDSIRAFAVLFVLFEHWLPKDKIPFSVPFGLIGVTVFFVLSGYLITQILFKSRNDAREEGMNFLHPLKQFYIRRTLRIFPIYYITIFILWILNIQNIREKILWFIFYASNIYFYKIQNFDGPLSHLWTLAVEEQFYIIWPLITLFTPRKYLFGAIAGITVFGMLFTSVIYYFSDSVGFSTNLLDILTPSCMDSFGLGAILAYFRVYRSEQFDFNDIILKIVFFLCLLMSVLFFFSDNIFIELLFNTNISVLSVYLISRASIGFKGITGKIFENRILTYLGKISYGLYLFHNFIPIILIGVGMPYIKNDIIRFMFQSLVLVMIASVSWFLIEKPINGLKKKFSYT